MNAKKLDFVGTSARKPQETVRSEEFYVDSQNNMVLGTPLENAQVGHEILSKKNLTQADIDQTRVLPGKAMQQQNKATSSQKLISKSEHCKTDASMDVDPPVRPVPRVDDEKSATGSSQRHRDKGGEKNPVYVPSKSGGSPPRHNNDKAVAREDPRYDGRRQDPRPEDHPPKGSQPLCKSPRRGCKPWPRRTPSRRKQKPRPRSGRRKARQRSRRRKPWKSWRSP